MSRYWELLDKETVVVEEEYEERYEAGTTESEEEESDWISIAGSADSASWAEKNEDEDSDDLEVNYSRAALVNPEPVPLEYQPWKKSAVADEELRNIADYLRPCDKSRTLRNDIIVRLKNMIYRTWGKPFSNANGHSDYWGEIVSFGSFEPQLYLPNGDMDVVVLTNKEGTEKSLLSNLCNIIRKDFAQNRIINFVANARVPIIKFNDSKTKINVDISARRVSGIKSTQWLVEYFQNCDKIFSQTAQSMIILLKQMLNNVGMNDSHTGGLGSFALCLMVLAFIETHKEIYSNELSLEGLNSFLNYYTNNFKYKSTMIQFSKEKKSFIFSKKPHFSEKLMVIDPTDSTCNTARAAYKYEKVIQAFKYFKLWTDSVIEKKNHSCFSFIFQVGRDVLSLKRYIQTYRGSFTDVSISKNILQRLMMSSMSKCYDRFTPSTKKVKLGKRRDGSKKNSTPKNKKRRIY